VKRQEVERQRSKKIEGRYGMPDTSFRIPDTRFLMSDIWYPETGI